jgi:hypothetical protein
MLTDFLPQPLLCLRTVSASGVGGAVISPIASGKSGAKRQTSETHVVRLFHRESGSAQCAEASDCYGNKMVASTLL